MSDAVEKGKKGRQPPHKKMRTDSTSVDEPKASGSGVGSSKKPEVDKGHCTKCLKSFSEVEDSLYWELCTECAPKCRSCENQDKYIWLGSKYCRNCTEDRKKPKLDLCDNCGGKVYSDWDSSDDSSDDGNVLCEYCEEEMNEEKKNKGK